MAWRHEQTGCHWWKLRGVLARGGRQGRCCGHSGQKEADGKDSGNLPASLGTRSCAVTAGWASAEGDRESGHGRMWVGHGCPFQYRQSDPGENETLYWPQRSLGTSQFLKTFVITELANKWHRWHFKGQRASPRLGGTWRPLLSSGGRGCAGNAPGSVFSCGLPSGSDPVHFGVSFPGLRRLRSALAPAPGPAWPEACLQGLRPRPRASRSRGPHDA